ncbi:MAG TPA: polysaccharide deacetylase family protein [Cyclobacteriaceae bacterium]|nr:polysaccharide deacetylase family protein [Cyclobacteriaceae bacterium]
MYHRFGDSRYPSTNISTQLFKSQLQYLKDNNFTVITFGEAIKRISEGGKIENKTVVLTIDDAYSTFNENALPLLNQFGFKATLFVNTETVGSPDYMNWEELTALVKNGFEIGNHSHSHAYFLNREVGMIDFFKEDVSLSRKLLEEKIGIDPSIFAYPYGEYNEKLLEETAVLGFQAAASQHSGVFCETTNPMAIPRFPMNDQYGSMPVFIEKANMKALRAKEAAESSTAYVENPPELKFSFSRSDYDLKRIQGYIQGGDAILEISGDSIISVSLKSNRRLSARRVIYTITVPAVTGKKWFWHSHLWIDPGIKD